MSMGLVFVVKTFADAVFLASYGMEYVPHLYVAQAAALIGLSFLYSWLVARGPLAIDTLIMLALAGTAGVAPLLPDVATFAVVLALVTLSTLAQLAVWNAVSSVVSGRTSRTFLPRAGAAATAGAVVGGFASSGIVALVGLAALAWVSAALTLATLAVRIAMQRRARQWRQSRSEPARSRVVEGARAPVRQLVVLLAAAVLVESLLGAFIDFGFKRELTDSFGSAQSIGVFFALYYGVTNVALLATQLFVSSRLLARWSLKSALGLGPLTLAVTAVVWAVFPVLAIAALARGLEGVMKFSVARPAQEVAMTPLPEASRRRHKVILRGVLAPVGAAVAGGLLLLLAPWFADSPLLLPVVCGVLAAALWVVSRASASHYLAALGSQLGVRQMARTDPETMLDRDTIAKLLELCGSSDRGAAAVADDALTRLVQSTAVLERHIGVGNAATRRAVYELLSERPSRACTDTLRAAIAREPETEGALEAGLLALAAHGDASQIVRARELVKVAGPLEQAAWVYLSRVGALDGEPAEHLRVLTRLIASDGVHAAAACGAAIDRGALASDAIDAALHALVAGDAAEPRAQALIAAACLGREVGIELVIGALAAGSSAERIAARLHGPGLARVASRVFADATPALERQRLLAALRVNEGPEITELAIRVLRERPALRDSAVRILLTRQGDTAIPRAAIERALGEEMDQFATYLKGRPGYASVVRESQMEVRFRGGVVDPSSEAFFLDELERCTERSLGRMCALLAVLGNAHAVFDAERGLRAPSFKRRNQALDVLQEVVHGPQKARLLELIDRYLMPTRAVAPDGRSAVLALDPWLARCANRDLDPTAKRLWALRSAPLFDAVDGDSLVMLAAHAEEVELAANAVIVREGEPGDALYIVMEGELAVERDERVVAELGPGESFGELALLDGEPRQATVRTRRSSRVLRLPRDTFEAALAAHPEIGLGLVLGLVKWLRQGRATARTSMHTMH